MKKNFLVIALMAVGAVSWSAIPAAYAQDATTPAMPEIKGMTPYTPECNYMSKAGYMRYRTFITQGRWMPFEEAARIVAEQVQ